MNYPKHPAAAIDVDILDGNPLSIVAAVSQALRRQGVPSSSVHDFQGRALSGDYDHVLRTAARWVSLRSDPGRPAKDEELRARFAHIDPEVAEDDDAVLPPTEDIQGIVDAYLYASTLAVPTAPADRRKGLRR